MKFILLIIALFSSIVYASDNFLDGTKRAEYFSITDDIVPNWDFTLPTNEYRQLKALVEGNVVFNDFKTKNAQLAVSFGDGTVKKFSEVTFSLGGVASKYFPKPGFNVKIRNDQLFGRRHFRIRSEAREATLLRSKVFCDMTNRLGQPDSISANYIKMSVNGEDIGFYVIMDSLKLSYVNIEYEDRNSTNLIRCANLNSDLTYKSLSTCESENKKIPDVSSFRELVRTLDYAETVAQMEALLDVKSFMKAVLLDYLTGSWDHFCIFGHNYSMYRPPNGKWEMILYDFDTTFGQDLSMGLIYGSPAGIDGDDIETWTKATFEDWSGNKHVVRVILQDQPEIFQECLQEIITNAFNPKLLFPHIDTLKEFIRPYVKEDKEKQRGRWNKESTSFDYTLSQWEANSEFTAIDTQFMTMSSQSYGLKRWILDKFNFVCTTYTWLDCSVASEYLDGQFTYTTARYDEPTNVPRINHFSNIMSGFNGISRFNDGYISGIGYSGWGGYADTTSINEILWKAPDPYVTTTVRTRKVITTTTTSAAQPTGIIQPTSLPQPIDSSCWSLSLGFPCCSSTNTEVYYEDEYGAWGVENDDWCGMSKGGPSCWSLPLGFPCCSICGPVEYVDDSGAWGTENGNWCGLIC